MFDLSGMNALVTGASGGIGSAVAKALAKAGAARVDVLTFARVLPGEVEAGDLRDVAGDFRDGA